MACKVILAMRYFLFFLFTFINKSNLLGHQNLVRADQYLQESKYDSALYLYNEVIKNSKDIYHDTSLAHIYIKTGKVLKLKEDFKPSLIHYNKALNLFEKHSNHNGSLKTYVNLAEFYRTIHNFEKALA